MLCCPQTDLVLALQRRETPAFADFELLTRLQVQEWRESVTEQLGRRTRSKVEALIELANLPVDIFNCFAV